ncbi:hypothetical protein KIF59_06775 [Enterobacter cloacae subsp. cloacae]|nr:hypothetical protein [Enterobacter cloacae subsp. cloacae]
MSLVLVFLLSDVIASVLHNPDLAPADAHAVVCLCGDLHGQQFRADAKELEFNKIGMIETSAPCWRLYLQCGGERLFWPLATDRHSGVSGGELYVRCQFGYFAWKIYRPA